MSKSPIPFVPLTVALLGGVLSLFSLAVWLLPTNAASGLDLNLNKSKSAADVPVIIYQDTAKVRSSIANTLSVSPFSQDRSAFEKLDAGENLPTPAMLPIEIPKPKLIGTVGRLEELEAIIIWSAGQAPQRLRLLSATPFGKVENISRDSVTFVDVAGRETVLRLFED